MNELSLDVVEPDVDDNQVRWSEYRQPHRPHWRYDRLPPLIFGRRQYEAAITALIQRGWSGPPAAFPLQLTGATRIITSAQSAPPAFERRFAPGRARRRQLNSGVREPQTCRQGQRWFSCHSSSPLCPAEHVLAT